MKNRRKINIDKKKRSKQAGTHFVYQDQEQRKKITAREEKV